MQTANGTVIQEILVTSVSQTQVRPFPFRSADRFRYAVRATYSETPLNGHPSTADTHAGPELSTQVSPAYIATVSSNHANKTVICVYIRNAGSP